MKLLSRWIPWFFVALFGMEIIAVMMPKKDGEYHVREFGALPVLLNGRIQPFDSVARNSLLQIRSTGDVPLEEVPGWKFWHHPKKLKSTPWLLEVMTRPQLADTRPIFLIHYSDLLGELKLQEKGTAKSGLRYYTFNDLMPVWDEILKQGQKASEIKPEEQTTFQKQVLKLANAVTLYRRLKFTLQPEGAENFSQELAEFQKNIAPAQAAARVGEGNTNFDKSALDRVAQPFQEFRFMADLSQVRIVPPLEPGAPRDSWQNAGNCLLESFRNDGVHPVMAYFATMADAYREEKPAEFNRALADYKAWLGPRFPKEIRKGSAEFYYNDVKAFLHATIIYICAFVLACVAILTFAATPSLSESLRRSSFYLILLAGLVHTFGLIFRMALEGRPPVTNLYSSAIFIGWAAMVLGIIVERIYRVGIGCIVASLAGFVTLLIAHNLALGGDTMEMLRAVLDTNFWLATHVVVVTLGYASTFFAGLLALIYVFLGVFTNLLRQPLQAATSSPSGGRPAPSITLGKALSKMVYGVVCFATLFSFVGTVLGGIWADQSWGRFWGWDPKENGALLIVLWNAIILHARWGGLVRDRGLMNLALFGNIVTSFSWFGVNLLSIGLHSYGFTDSGAAYLLNFVVSQLVLLGNGVLCLQAWRSMEQKAAGAGRSFRTWLVVLNVFWLLTAIVWFSGVFSQQHAVGFSGVFEAMPWLISVGKYGSFICAGLIWVLAGASYLLLTPPREPEVSLPAAVPAK